MTSPYEIKNWTVGGTFVVMKNLNNIIKVRNIMLENQNFSPG